MLPPNYLDEIANQCVVLYGNIETLIIKEITDRILAVGYANTVVKNDAEIAQQMGILYTDIVNQVTIETNKNYSEILKIFTEAGILTIKNDDKIYKKAGLNPIPINQDSSMLQILTATAEKTNKNLSNLTMTTASTSQQDFYNAMNNAYMEVITGAKSYSQSIVDVIDELSEKGASVIYPSGYKTSLENATRMNIVTGVNQTCGTMQKMRAEELGWDLMELTAFSDSRPTHAEWQGKIVSLSGKAGYLTIEDIGYGKVDGFKGINCRHDWNPYYEGSSRTYSDKMLEQYKNAKVTYNGQEISLYDATQLQRKYERQIRVDKKKIAGRERLLTSITTDKTEKELRAGLNYHKARLEIDKTNLNDLLKQTKLKQQYDRTVIPAKGEYRTKSVVNYAKKLYNKNSKIENLQGFVDDETIRKHIRNKQGEKFENQNVFAGKQNKHIVGTNEYKTLLSQNHNPSIVTLNNEEIQNLVDKYAGTGRILRDKNANSTDIELIISDDYVGYAVNKKGQTLTKKAEIHYSKNGVHIVPTTRRK